MLVDAGVFEPLPRRTSPHEEVAAAAGADIAALREAGDRGAAVEAMCRGAAAVVARLHEEGRLDGILSVGGSGNSSIAAAAMRGAARRRPEADRLDGRLRRHPAVRRRDRRLDDLLGRRHLRAEPDLRADPLQRRRRDRRDGEGRASPKSGGGDASDRRDDVRRHDAGGDAGARAAGGARLRGARLPRDRHRRPVDGGARPRRLPRRRARPDDDRAGRRARRRRALGRAGPARGGGRARAAAGRLARRARHGQLRPARDRAAAVRGPQPLRPQPDGHADADDARGVRRARPADRAQALRARPGRPRCSCR